MDKKISLNKIGYDYSLIKGFVSLLSPNWLNWLWPWCSYFIHFEQMNQFLVWISYLTHTSTGQIWDSYRKQIH